MSPKDKRNELLASRMIRNLERRHFEAYYCRTAEEITDKVKELIPEGSSITWGGTMTIRDLGIPAALKSCNYVVYDRDEATTADPLLRGRQRS